MKSELAGTTKLLKSVTSLRFANRRTCVIEADPSWLAKSKLTPTAQRQLVAVLGPDGEANAEPGEQNVEWFDVFDQDNVVQFQLWLRGTGRGVLFKAATTVSVAMVGAASFAGSGSGLDEATGERLAALLRSAKKIAAKLHPGSALASVAF